MELREKAGNEDMMTVEKKLERQKAKTEHRLKQMASATENQQSVFDFINSKLTHNTSQDSTKGSLFKLYISVVGLSIIVCYFC